jgi:sugar/nucleoside kinase (ribokinase family)
VTTAYEVVVGTGGIGAGIFLALHGDRTLGREESRPATLLDQRDACKLHIVLHYVRRLLDPGVAVVPIGMVGDDAPGRDALAQLRAEDIDVSLIETSSNPTLFSVCFQYPNGDGGNLTTVNSASGMVGPDLVGRARPTMIAHRDRGIAVALPEVPMPARAALLDLATEAGFLRVATFTSLEWEEVHRMRLLERVDLLAVNLDEAAAATGTEVSAGTASDVVSVMVDRVRADNPELSLVITAGRQGSWAWDGAKLAHTAPLNVTPVNTAGAGDAHLAGLIVGSAGGMTLAEANLFATLVSSLSVTSRHTINTDLSMDLVREAASGAGWPVPPALAASIVEQ